jgi:hypothetical protein
MRCIKTFTLLFILAWLLPSLAYQARGQGDPAGIWIQTGTGTNCDYGTDLATDNTGNVYVCGSFTNSITFGTAPALTSGTFSEAAYVVKYSPAGAVLWSKTIVNRVSLCNAWGLDVVKATGEVYVTGTWQTFAGTGAILDFGTSTSGGTTTVTGSWGIDGQFFRDIWVCRLATATGNTAWAVTGGTHRDDEGHDVTVDNAGNAYVTGHYYSVNLPTGGCNNYELSFGTTPPTTTCAGVGARSRFVPTRLNSSTDLSTGFVFVGGSFVQLRGDLDVFVARFAAGTGACDWITVGGARQNTYNPLTGTPANAIQNTDMGWGVTVNGGGTEVYITGEYAGVNTTTNQMIFVESTTSASVSIPFGNNFGNQDIYVARLNGATGTPVWATNFGSTTGTASPQPQGTNWGNSTERGYEIDLGDPGFVYVTGDFVGSCNFRAGGTLASSGQSDMFIARLATATGVVSWARRGGSFADDRGYDISTNAAGVSHIIGAFSNTGTFGAGVTSRSITSTGSNDWFVARVTNVGDFDYAIRGGTNNYDEGFGIDTWNCEVFTHGYFWGPSPFTISNLPSARGTGCYDVATVRLTDGPYAGPITSTTSSTRDTVCSNGNTVRLTLPQIAGVPLRWEVSNNCLPTPNFTVLARTFVTTDSFLVENNITQTTCYRAIVRRSFPACSDDISLTKTIIVDQFDGGNLTSTDVDVCSIANDITMTLSGLPSSGLPLPGVPARVLRWESSNDCINFTLPSTITNTTTSLRQVGLTTTTCFRVFSQNGIVCPNAVSDTLRIQVNPLPRLTVSPAGPALTTCVNYVSNFVNNSTLGTPPFTFSWQEFGLPTAATITCVDPPFCGLTDVVMNSPASRVFKVLVVDNNGCRDSLNYTINALASPTVVPGPPVTRCANALPVNITTGGTALTYTWTPGGLTGTTVSVSPPVGVTTYTITGTNVFGCTATGSVAVTVDPTPVIDITPDLPSRCEASLVPTVLTANSDIVPATFVWTPGGATTPTISVSPTITTTYTVTGTVTATGCTSTARETLTVIPIVAPPTPSSVRDLVCPDERGTVYTVTRVTGATYTWTVPGAATLVSGAGTNSIVVDWRDGAGVPAPSGPYTITVFATILGCAGNPTTINVTVNNPAPTVPPVLAGTTPVCRGTVGTYTLTPAGVPGASSFEWRNLPTGAFITSTTGAFGENVSINWGSAAVGSYAISARGRNICGVGPEGFFTVNVITTLPVPSVITPPAPICIGTAGTYSVVPDPNATNYTWTNSCGWAGVLGAAPSNSIDYTPTAGGPCLITVSAINACGSSEPRSLVVTPTTVPLVPSTVSGDLTVCSGDVASRYNVLAVAGVTYAWSVTAGGPTIVSGGATNEVTLDWSTATLGATGDTTYTITVTPSNACGVGPARNHTVTLRRPPVQPVVSAGPNPVCHTATSTYRVTAVAGVTYAWSVSPTGPVLTSSGNSATINWNRVAAGPYTITITPSNRCGAGIARDTIINVDAVVTATVPPPAVTCASATSITGAAPAGGTWACVTCPGGFTSIDAAGNVFGLTVPGARYVFRYTVTGGACPSSSALATVLYDVPNSGTLNADATICEGGNGRLTLTGFTGRIVRWERDDDCDGTATPISNITSTHTYLGLTRNTCFRVFLQGSTTLCNGSSNSVTITVTPRVLALGSPSAQTSCGLTATVTGNLPAGTTGAWSFISGPSVATITTGAAGVGNINGLTNAGTYVFRWTLNNGGCGTTTSDVTVRRVLGVSAANAGLDASVCVNNTTINGNTPVAGTPSWRFIGGGTGASIPAVTTVGITGFVNGIIIPGTYFFEYSITGGCGLTRDTVVVTRIPAVTVSNAGADQTVCAATATVNGNALAVGETGTWSFVFGPSPASITQALPNDLTGNITGMATPGRYRFRWTIANGVCPPSLDDVEINVLNPPSPATLTTTTYSVCNSTGIVIRAVNPTSGTGVWTLVSQPGGATASVASSGVDGIVSGMNLVGTYQFAWTVSIAGCAGSSAATATVERGITVPPVTASPNQRLCFPVVSTTVTGSALPPNTTGQWVYVSGPTSNTTVTTAGTIGTITNLDVPGLYIFEWRVNNINGTCPASTAAVTITMEAPPTVSNAGLDQTICGTTATLTGNTPTRGTGRWIFVGGPVTPTISQSRNLALVGGMNVTGIYRFSWEISNGVGAVCPASADEVLVNVSTPTVPGFVSAPATLCSGTGSGTLNLTGHTGSVVRWESSTDNFATVVNVIPNVTATQNYSGLTTTTQYRAIVRNGTCPELASGATTITVVQAPSVANGGADQTFCGPVGFTTLIGNVPTVGTGTWMYVGGTGPAPGFSIVGNTVFVFNLLEGTYRFVWMISNPPCVAGPANNDEVIITVNPSSVGGFVGSPATVCSGSNTGTLTLGGQRGSVIRWESSTDNFSTASAIANTSTSNTYNNLLVTTQFRAVVQSGSCAPAFSSPVTITVIPQPTVANAGADQSFCAPGSTATIVGNLPLVGMGSWHFVAGPVGATPVIGGTGNIGNVTGLTVDGVYTFEYRITNAPCPVSTDQMTIERFVTTVVGSLTAPATVCSGLNSGSLTVTGQTGNIVRWESSTDGFITILTSPGGSPTFGYSGLTQTTQYRAVVRAGVCPELTTNIVTITVVPQPTVSTAGSDQIVCVDNAVLLGSTPVVGTGTWSLVSGPGVPIFTPSANPLSISGLSTAGTYVFRWTIANAPCAASSDEVNIIRQPNTVIADAGVDQRICADNVLLTGNNPGTGSGAWRIASAPAGPAPTLTPIGLSLSVSGMTTPGDYVFEYTISNPPCLPSVDAVTVTRVAPPAGAAVVTASTTVCDIATATIQALTPTVGTGTWSFVSGPATASIATGGLSGFVTGMTVNGTYIFRWTVTNAPCGGTSTADAVVIRQTGLGIPPFAGSDQSICDSPFALLIGNSIPSGATGRWRYIGGPDPLADVTTFGNFGSAVNMNLPGTYSFAWEFTPTNGCPTTSDAVQVTRVARPTTAVAGPSSSICGTSVILTGNVPVHGTGAWTFVSGPASVVPTLSALGSTLTASSMSVPGTYVYRWAITNAPCPVSAFDVPVTVNGGTAAGSLSGAATVCSGTNSGNLTLSGQIGGIVRWETSRDGFVTVNTISSTSANLPYTNLTESTCYRVIVRDGACPQAASNIVCVTVRANVTTATASPNQDICGNAATVTGNAPVNGTGTWSLVSSPGGSSPILAPVAEVLNVSDMNVAGDYIFRWRIDNTPCGISDASVRVRVTPAPVPGMAMGSTTVCGTPNSGTISLSGHSGTIVRWESSIDGTTFTPIANTSSLQGYFNLPTTTWYRAVVRTGTCPEEFSTPAQVTVVTPTIANAGPNQALCGTNTTVTGNTPAAGTGTWTITSSPGGSSPFLSQVGVVGNLSNLTVNGTYILTWTITNPPCPVTTSNVAIVVNGTATGGTVSPPATLCAGSNIHTMTVSGFTGSVLRWESSNDNFGSNIVIHNNPTASHTVVNLTESRRYRAVISSGSCPSVNSTDVLLTIVPATVVANAGAPQSICGNNTSLTGNDPGPGTGNWTFVIGPFGAAPAITTPTNRITTITNLNRAGTYVFRWTITNPPCGATESDVLITVLSGASAGSVLSATTVCSGTNSGVLTLTGNSGPVVRWESAPDPTFTTGVNTLFNTTEFQPYSGLTTTTFYRAVVSDPSCGNVFSSPVNVTVIGASSGGTITGPASVCGGTNSGTLTLSGHSGTIVRWEEAVDGFTFTPIANTTPIQTFTNLPSDRFYRAVINTGICGNQFSSTFRVVVTPASVAGTLAADQTVCTGTNSGTLNLTGQVGTVIRWETSTNGFIGVTTISTSSPSLNFVNLTQTTQYRVVVQSGSCAPAVSNVATVTVATATIPGTLAGSTTACSGANSGAITLSGQTGTVVRWETSTDPLFGTVTPVVTTVTTFNFVNLTQTTYFRAFVQNGSCAGAFSSSATVTVLPTAVGGTTSANATVCSGSNSGTINLTGQTGTITRWESSTDGITFGTTIANTTTSLSYNNLTQTTWYRAVVTSGSCGTANSTPTQITVTNVSVAGVIIGGDSNCGSQAFGTMTLTGFTGNVVRWEESFDCFASAPIVIANTTSTLAYSGVTSRRCYRAIVRNGACAEATTPVVEIQAFAPSVGGTVSGASTFCAGGSASLTLTGQTGTVVRWESSTTGFSSVTPIANTTTTLVVSGISATTQYRAVVRNGTCPEANSSSVSLTVTPGPVLQAQAVVGCEMIGSVVATATGGAGSYTYTISPAVAGPNITGVFAPVPSGSYTITASDGGSCVATASVFVGTTMTPPVIRSVTSITTSSAIVNWAAVPGAITYTLRYRVVGSLTWTTIPGITGDFRFVSGLQNGTQYDVELSYTCTSGGSGFSTGIVNRFTTLSGVDCMFSPPTVPGGIFVNAVGTSSARVNWNPVPGAAGYIISFGLASLDPATYTQVLVCSPTTSYTMGGLVSSTPYRVRIRTNCTNCTSALQVTDNRSAFSTLFGFTTAIIRDQADVQAASTDFVVYPNPNNGAFNVRFNGNETQPVNIQVASLTGQIVYRQAIAATNGENNIPVALTNVAAGVYILELRAGDQVQTIKLVVE